MTPRAAFTAITVCLALVFPSAAVIAQTTGIQARDPVSGSWGEDGRAYLELKLEDNGRVSGTTIWRIDEYVHRAPIKTGSFDAKTGRLTLQGEAKGPDGEVRAYVIEGQVEGDTVAGTFKLGDGGGEFTFRRQ